ncbi:cobalamin (vitamin B12) biosynthesis CbiX protein [Plesiocystis pacifica SIR-1]|uniref:Cobalamin (Vitamin B12) biosynthesis CbiX protein n=1 Tax=Plesiocystis pacifica SIR-1 TaxID=391625 RepID=A6G4F4_9BACT|nr:CbiX/SirB N-terminal domain-containing protein [Plesiocystis pacifica]EDM79266.1 cobalamin (vitamin B12) biosynthesis CbiX protein [Plesiocystis pacifica SIR-1]
MTDPADAPAGLALVAHGSPDPDWRRPLEALATQLAERLGCERVALAYLAHEPHLDDAIATLAEAGSTRVRVIAALLSPGGKHVKRDIPATVEAAQARFPALRIELAPGALGDDPRVIEALAAAALDRL